MNSSVTDDNKVYTYEMPRAELRHMLIDAQRPARYHYDCDTNPIVSRICERGTRCCVVHHGKHATRYEYPYDFHDHRASLWECAGLTLFALLMLGGLAVAISWGLR